MRALLSDWRRKTESLLARAICLVALWWPAGSSRQDFLDQVVSTFTAQLAMISDPQEQATFMLVNDEQLCRLLGQPPGFFVKRFLGVSTVSEEFVDRCATVYVNALRSVPDAMTRAVLITEFDRLHHARLGLRAGGLGAACIHAIERAASDAPSATPFCGRAPIPVGGFSVTVRP